MTIVLLSHVWPMIHIYASFSEYSLPLVPLTDVYVSQVNSSYISFTWTPPLLHCQPFAYFVYAYNCGECPNLVTDHTMTCMYVEADGRMCSFHIQRRACNITGKNSSTFSILLTRELVFWKLLKSVFPWDYSEKLTYTINIDFINDIKARPKIIIFGSG